VELAHPTDALVRPWRRATVIATSIAAIELVLLVAAGIVLLGRHLAHHAGPASAPTRHATTKPGPAKTLPARPEPVGQPRLARSETSVLVLNGTGRSGAAALEANVVSARGYRLGRVGNAPRTGYTKTVVMYRPGFRAEAARLAHDIGVTLFAPLDGLTPSALGGAQLAVVVGDS
jgi:hypothetical protein